MLEEFLKSAAGHAVAGVLIAALAVLIVELNYRLFFKYTLDFIFALLFTLILSPLLLVCAAVSKYKNEKVLERIPCLGVRGKVIYTHKFTGASKAFANLAYLFDVLAGRMSFVGVKLMTVQDGAFLDDAAMNRFAARPGIFNYLAARGGEELSYEKMFELDARYAKKRELFYDIFAVLATVALAIRGEGKCYLGEAAKASYTETLLARGAIDESDAEKAEALAKEAVEEHEKRRDVKKSKYN